MSKWLRMMTDVRNRNMAGDSITNGFNNMLLVEGRLHVVFSSYYSSKHYFASRRMIIL